MENTAQPTDLTELTDQIKLVATARKDKAYSSEAIRELMVVWESRNKDIIDASATHKARLEEAEKILRDLTIAVYNLTGNKHPAEGVGIRETTKLDYDPAEAMKWAIEHKLALQLDTKKFVDYAKDGSIEFVTVMVVPQATIAKELEVEP